MAKGTGHGLVCARTSPAFNTSCWSYCGFFRIGETAAQEQGRTPIASRARREECLKYAERVRYRNGRAFMLAHKIATDTMSAADALANSDVLRRSAERDRNDQVPAPPELWRYVERTKVARVQERSLVLAFERR